MPLPQAMAVLWIRRRSPRGRGIVTHCADLHTFRSVEHMRLPGQAGYAALVPPTAARRDNYRQAC